MSHPHATLKPYNTAHLLNSLNILHDNVFQPEQRGPGDPEQKMYVPIWDVSFHCAAQVCNWFHDHDRFTMIHLPPYSPFLKIFSAWQWKVYDHKPHEHMALLQAMEEACGV